MKNKTTYELVDLLLKKELDLLIVNLPLEKTSGLEITELKQVQDVFVASEKYAYLKEQSITFEQLKTLPIIANSKGSVTRNHFDYCCEKNNVSIIPHIEAVRNSLLVDFCILGLGIGFTAYEFIKKEITENNLYVLEVEPNIPPRSIGIVTRNEPKSEMINDLISILKKDKI